MDRKNIFAFAALLLLLAVSAVAQTSTSNITGVVKDESGGVLPGVEVVATRTATGERRKAITNDSGVYRVNNVTPGVYSIRAALDGFKTTVNRDVRVPIGETRRSDLILAVGEITEEVVVQAQAETVNTEEGRISQLVESAEISELPLNGRNAYQLAQLGPGVFPTMGVTAQDAGSNAGASFVVNGQRHRGNNFLMDGTDNNYVGIAGVPSVTPQVDIIEEFQVQTNNFSAEFGRNAGAIVNVLTKSGTNDIHGTAYWFHRNDALDAAEFFAPFNPQTGEKDKAPLRQHTAGFTIGGPIKKDKTFAFGGYEAFREFSGEPAQFTVETQQLLDFVNQNRAGSLAAMLFQRFPLVPANAPTTGEDIGSPLPGPETLGPPDGIPDQAELNLFGASAAETEQWNVRVDHTFSDSDKMYARFTRHLEDFPPTIVRASVDSVAKVTEQAATVSETHVFNPTMVNEFRVGWNEREPNFDVQEGTFDVPTIGISGFSPDFGAASNIPQFFARHTYQLANSFSWARGDHSLKMGFEFRHGQENSDFQASTRGVYSFEDILDFIDDDPASQSNLVNSQGTPVGTPRHFRVNEWALYFQDDWKFSPNLTLNLGLRYENFRPPFEKDSIQTNIELGQGADFFDRYANSTVVRRFRGQDDIYAPDNNNFAPRVGFAWDPTGEGKWAIRGGYGISYNRIFMNITSNIKFNFPTNPTPDDLLVFGQVVNASTSNNLPIRYTIPSMVDPALLGTGGGGRVNPNFLDPDLATTYVHSIFFGVQHEIWNDWLVEANYVSTLGRKLYAQEHYNRFAGDLIDGTLDTRNPLWLQNDDFLTASINQAYHSGQFSLNKRFRDGLGFRANYTWAKNIDDDTDVFGTTSEDSGSAHIENRKLDRGLSSLSVFHRFAMNWVWDMPWFKQADNFFARNVLGGWQVNGLVAVQSGLPASINADSSSFTSRTGGVRRGDFNADGHTSDRPDAATFDHTSVTASDSRRGSIFAPFSPNPSNARLAFPRPAAGLPGTLGRNTFFYDVFNSVDFSLFKNFRTPWFGQEDARLQFRAEVFNLFNWVNVNPWEENIASSRFGRASSVQDARELQFALKFIF